MRDPVPGILLAGLLLTGQVSGAGGGAPAKVTNPWKPLPAGTELEFRISTDESVNPGREKTHADTTEVWRVLANDGRVATIEVTAGGTKKVIARDLAPVDPPPAPAEPTGPGGGVVTGGPDGQDHLTTSTDRIDTAFGPIEALRIDHHRVWLESESRGSEWRAPDFPEPLRAESVSSGGAGVVRTVRETRTLVRFDVPGRAARPAPAVPSGSN